MKQITDRQGDSPQRGGQSVRTSWTSMLPTLAVSASLLAAGIVLARAYSVDGVTDAAARANGWLLILAVVLGVLSQLIRAHRVQRMLRVDRPVRLGDSYGAMVVGHGIGDLVPLIPSGPVLRSVLTQRLSGTPFSFSAGVYMLEGMLDGLMPAGLIAYLLLVLPLPDWARAVMIAALIQATALFLIPVLLSIRGGNASAPKRDDSPLAALQRMGRQVRSGLETLTSQGRAETLRLAALSCIVTGVAGLQLAIFLRAFGLSTSPDRVLLLLVLTLASGSIPIKIPGSGTLATAAVMPLAGIHGPGLAGFVAVSRVVLSSETVVLAGIMLGWWTLTRNQCLRGIGDLFHLARCVVAPRAALVPEHPEQG